MVFLVFLIGASKPDDGYEDPKDVQAIKEAQLFMGDFNLKTASDYKIPEHMRINAAKKEEETGVPRLYGTYP